VNEILDLAVIGFRLIWAVVLLGFMPGFALSWWLFARSGIDLLERIFISSLLSVILSGFSAYGLVISGKGVSPAGLSVTLGLMTLIFIAGAVHVRRWQGTFQQIAKKRASRVFSRLSRDYPLAILTGLFAVIVFSGLVYHLRIAEDTDTLTFTEFYVDPVNLTESGVLYAVENGYLEVPVTIVNHEDEDKVYRIESEASRKISGPSGQMNMIMPVNYHRSFFIDSIEVAASEHWSGIVSVKLPDTPVDFVEIKLFYAESQNVQSTLRIWISDQDYLIKK
jgi:uncharacterized membrane protein